MTVAQRATADAMIAAKGQAVTLTRRASGAYNPATGAAAITTSTQTGKGVILPLGAGLRKMAGTNIPDGAVQCLLSGLTATGATLTAPQIDDTLTDANSRVWTVIEVNPLAPAGLPIMFDLTLKGAA